MLFHEINLFLLIFLITCSLFGDAATTSSPATTVPSTEEKLERVVAFTEGITAIIEVFNSPEPVGRNLTKLLSASRKCGLVLHAGLLFDRIKDTPQVQNLFSKSYDLKGLIDKQNSNISSAERVLALFVSIYDIQRTITYPLESLMKRFIAVMQNKYSAEYIKSLKDICKSVNPRARGMLLAFKHYLSDVQSKVINADYSDHMYENFHIIYHLALKQTLGMGPMCRIYNYGLSSVAEQKDYSDDVIETIREVRKKFADLNNLRKQNYWKNESITTIVKRIVFNNYMAPHANNIIGEKLFLDLTFRYKSFGYNFHVGVSNAAQRGHNDTLIQCSTECHYLYNFLGKDIYVMRTKKSQKGQNYSSCQHLDRYENETSSYNTCSQLEHFHEDLVPLASEIANNCTGVAFSLVRSQLDYFAFDGSHGCKWVTCVPEYSGFTSKCKDGVHIVFANYPI